MAEELAYTQATRTPAELDRKFYHPNSVYSVIDTIIRIIEIADRTFERGEK